MRTGERRADELRPVHITPDFVQTADGSALISCGNTRVICTASIEEGVPPFLKGKGQGWLTAEYAMLPASTGRRKARELYKRDGRSVEIQRLIGRSLRACVDMKRLGECTVYLDCDVLQADGGTRTASITGAFVALCLAIEKRIAQGLLAESPIVRQLAAVSAGVVDNEALLDLEYVEDSRAQVDCNIVMTRDRTGSMEYVEVQLTGEGRTMRKDEFSTLLSLAEGGIETLMREQREALGESAGLIGRKPRLVIATSNFGKLKEMRALLGERFDVVSMRELGLNPEIDENGQTFEENALIKAETLQNLTGLACIADDSGLEVDALGGRPGVHSARYAGVHGDDEANNRLLLEELAEADAPRTARYACAIALCRPGRPPIVTRGVCEGEILREYRGEGGFGYDPLFYSYDLQMGMGEAGFEEKNRISHRGRAIVALLERLEEEE